MQAKSVPWTARLNLYKAVNPIAKDRLVHKLEMVICCTVRSTSGASANMPDPAFSCRLSNAIHRSQTLMLAQLKLLAAGATLELLLAVVPALEPAPSVLISSLTAVSAEAFLVGENEDDVWAVGE